MLMCNKCEADCDKSTIEQVRCFIDELDYQLQDGIGLPCYKRKFTTDESELIEAVMTFIGNKIERYFE